MPGPTLAGTKPVIVGILVKSIPTNPLLSSYKEAVRVPMHGAVVGVGMGEVAGFVT